MIAQGLQFSDAKDTEKIQTVSFQILQPNSGGIGYTCIGDFWQIACHNSKMVQDRCIVLIKV